MKKNLSLEEKILFIEDASYEALLEIAKEDEMGSFFSEEISTNAFIKKMKAFRTIQEMN